MNYRGSAGHVAKSSVGGGERIGGLGEPWFPVRITGERSTGDSGLDVVSYTAVEVWIDGGGNTIDKVGGRVLGTTNPGVPLDSATTFAVDDLALARPAHGAGGLIWEMVPYNAAAADPSTPGSPPTCTGSKWWRQLRSDSRVAFALSVTAKGAGACNCADDAYSSTADFDTDSWDAADQITICTVAYDVEITKPNGVPTLTLTPSGGGTAVTVPAECYGDGWAQFTFPGDVSNEGICTDPVAEGCDGDNGFTIRVICACVAENYDGPGWYILAEDYNVGGIDRDAGDAIELTSGAISVSGVDCPVLCPGGPHADQATAEANSCFLESPCYSGFLIPTALEVEYYDGTGDLACYNGTVHNIDWSPSNGVWCDVVSGYITEDVPCGFDGWRNIFQCGGGAFILTSNSDPPGAGSPVDPSKTGASVSGTGPTFEAVFTGMTDISFPNATGTLSAVVRARAA